MNQIKKTLRDPKTHAVILTGLLILGVLAFAFWKTGTTLADLKNWWTTTESFLATNPAWLFAGLVILPGLPVPTTALLILASTVWKNNPAAACAACVTAMILNMTWTYWLAAKPGRNTVEKILSFMEIKIPLIGNENPVRWILLMRLTPGIPTFVQNYSLGFVRVPFLPYILISTACNGLMTCGIVLGGAGFAKGNLLPAAAGIALIVLSTLLIQFLRKRIGRRKAALIIED